MVLVLGGMSYDGRGPIRNLVYSMVTFAFEIVTTPRLLRHDDRMPYDNYCSCRLL